MLIKLTFCEKLNEWFSINIKSFLYYVDIKANNLTDNKVTKDHIITYCSLQDIEKDESSPIWF
jgi:hypothetical protein